MSQQKKIYEITLGQDDCFFTLGKHYETIYKNFNLLSYINHVYGLTIVDRYNSRLHPTTVIDIF